MNALTLLVFMLMSLARVCFESSIISATALERCDRSGVGTEPHCRDVIAIALRKTQMVSACVCVGACVCVCVTVWVRVCVCV